MSTTFPEMGEPRKPRHADVLFRRAMFGCRNPRHTWFDVGRLAGTRSDAESDFLLWSSTAFPFAGVRRTWYQLRHAMRHRTCVDDPWSTCFSERRG